MPPVREGVLGARQMRRGTHSCVPCRRRKVRCIFPPSSDVCAHCARRGAVCLPQGLRSESPVAAGKDLAFPEEQVTLTEALESLRKRVDRSLQHVSPTSTDHSQPEQLSGTTGGAESVQTDCAPVIKLFDNEVITRLVKRDSATGDLGYSLRESQTTPHSNAALPPRHAEAVRGLCAALPPEYELKGILDSRADWWNAWRDSYGLIWGDEADSTPHAFAIRAFCSGHPALLGSLLVCLALCIGAYDKYLPPVERWILHDDELAGCEYGLQCLMGLGLCFFSAIQPRRAWSVFRRANTLLQLNGIHRTHRKSERLDSVFWQLFHADRWMSLMIGLPYSMPDDLCDLYIPQPNSTPLITFHYRHLAVLTGRVIDCLQSLSGPSLSTIAKINEQIDFVATHLPPEYLDLGEVSSCPDAKEKYTRVFRITQVHQLKSYLHLPLFLQRADEAKRAYGRSVCVDSSRSLLEAFLVIYDDNPTRAVMDNNIKLTGFSAFAAAVTLFLHVLDCGQTTKAGRASANQANLYDENIISRTMVALKDCAGSQASSLCGQCHTALEGLVSTCREAGNGKTRRILLPYFGVVSVGKKQDNQSRDQQKNNRENFLEAGYPPSVAAQDTNGDVFDIPFPLDDIFWDYQGPLMVHDHQQSVLPADGQYHVDPEFDWSEIQLPFDWEAFS